MSDHDYRRGWIACREYMARFVEAQSPTIAQSIRLNWDPRLGQEPYAPWQPKPFECCGAADPPCLTFEGSCQNPANYGKGAGFCPKCKEQAFPFCATAGCPEPIMSLPTRARPK